MNRFRIEYFIALAESLSYTKTAERFYVSQPAVSKQIKALEDELGVKLFARKGRSIVLTPSGRIVLDAYKNALFTLDDAVEKAKMLEEKPETHINMGMLEGSSTDAFYKIAAEFQRQHADVSIHIEVLPIAKLADNFNSGKFDMIVNHEYGIRKSPNVECHTLKAVEHIGFISESHPLASKPNLCFKDFNSERFYIPCPSKGALTLDYCKFICLHHNFRPKETYSLPNIESVFCTLKMGMGVTVLDDMVICPPDAKLIKVRTSVYSNVMFAWNRHSTEATVPLLAEEIIKHL
ncbi:MAG: LysR family transcriptional regulator [Clostridiales Family XIII bacterium]|jgi:DNA-binding transcriptional LysR family regulator|nr:LysR family transcriptional regulator [Clostridiales Family XIII bacterium]